MSKVFYPKTLKVLKEGYDFNSLTKDLIAGIIVGIVALPLSIALAIASGVKPEQGLYTAIIAGFIIAFLGGSRVQIGGPTGAFVVIVYSIVQKFGYDGLATASVLAGIILVLFGAFRLGSFIKFIPYPVTVGFTSGIALLIFTSQIKDFLGLHEKAPAEFLEKIPYFIENTSNINFYSIFIGLITIIIVLFWSKKFKKIPGSLIAIIVTTILVNLFKLPVDTIGSVFGDVPNSFPPLHFPHINFLTVKELLPSAFTIAMLAGIESLLSAVVADGMIGTKHNSNTELIAQGIANIFSPIFGGIPATGAIARTATNIKNGGRTPFAGMFHSITLLMIMLFLGKLAKMIPMATLSGILMIVAYNMSEIQHFIKLRKAPKSDFFILLITFLLTVLADLTVAIQFGIVLSALLFMKRMSEVTEADFLKKEYYDTDEEFIASGILENNTPIPKEIEIFEINGPFFFGAASIFRDNLGNIETLPKFLILRMRNVSVIDATGLSALETIIKSCKKNNIQLIISGINKQPLNAIQKIGLNKEIGDQFICKNINDAITIAKKHLK
ncbi:MAG: sulfate permease, SulP family [Fusobacteriaceae bacterium]|jgi:SulP family sulfate permease|nr:sulfate transporter [Fusobacteriales bacterium]MDN5303545.1 sulfate permease, SulP family [Fusobacteriaceae bacterium]